MSVQDEQLTASSDSFWEVDCYRRTVKRHEDGHKLCGDLISLIQERAEIEKQYAKSLRGWSHKWNGLIDKGPEYGTCQSAWKGSLQEADNIAELHDRIKDRLIEDVKKQVKKWQTENYTKPMVGSIKEAKELEDGFRKAQKPWSKRLKKVIDARKEYHNACRLEKTAIHQESNARGDSAVSPDQLKKLQDKVEKYKNDVETTRKKYEAALNEINSYNAKYMEDMTEVFNKSQEYEEKRLKFFKEMLFGVQKSLNLSETDEYQQIYANFWQTVNNAESSQDLRLWSQHHGVDMSMNWPTFEEYSPEARAISSKSKKSAVPMSDGITLTSLKSNNAAPSTQSYDNYSMNNQQNQQNRIWSSASLRTVPTDHTYSSIGPPVPKRDATHSQSQLVDLCMSDIDGAQSSWQSSTNPFSTDNGEQNPFGDQDWEEQYETQNVDDTKGVPVRALYDYVGQEEDELSFKSGDLFMKLLDADDQGWCTGKKDGKVGLYPNNYVESVD